MGLGPQLSGFLRLDQVEEVGGQPAGDVGAATAAVEAATPSSTPSTIVARDSSGNIAVNQVTGDVVGDVTGNVTGAINGLAISTGVHDPSVTGKAATAPAWYDRTTEYLPKTLAKLNEIFLPWGATFAHAWALQEASGNAADLALTGGVALNPNRDNGVDVPPDQNISTGLTDYVTDKGVQFTEADTLSRLAAANHSDLAVTTGSVVLLMTVRLIDAPAADKSLMGKSDDTAAAFWTLMETTAGKPKAFVYDGSVSKTLVMASDHTGATYHDILMVVDRASASKLMSLNTSLEDAGTIDISTMANSLDGAGDRPFGIGWVRGLYTNPNMIVTFAALGTVPGTLVANRVAALAAYSSARAAPRQIWSKYGSADTAWSKVGP